MRNLICTTKKLFFSLRLVCLSGFIMLLICSCTDNKDTVTGLFYADSQPSAVTFREGRIVAVRHLSDLPDEKRNLYIAPGFIDIQVNGFAGVSFTFGGEELTADGVKKATEELWKTGVTTFIPTLTTNSNELLTKNFRILSGVMNDPGILGSIPGFHLEGPYISALDGFRGAHPVKHVRRPDWDEFTVLNAAAGNKILEVTVAPEVDGAMEFISKCRKQNIIVALGHHNGDAASIKQAIDSGAQIATHLGNGCANMINRHLNPLWPQLADDRLMISIIGDGFHLNSDEINVFYKIKGSDKTIITSDVTSYAALSPGRFVNNEGDTLELTPEGMVRYPAQNVLAGSASPLIRGISNIMKVTGCTLEEAVNMVTRNPAGLFGLTDRGTIERGKRADLVLFRIVDNEIFIEETIVGGKVVYLHE